MNEKFIIKALKGRSSLAQGNTQCRQLKEISRIRHCEGKARSKPAGIKLDCFTLRVRNDGTQIMLKLTTLGNALWKWDGNSLKSL